VIKLKSGIRIQALIRHCDVIMLPVAILNRGDADSGAIILKLNSMDGNCDLLTQTRDDEGNLVWMRPKSDQSLPENQVDEYINRQIKRDPDLWVVEIEDFSGKFIPVEPII